MPNVGVLARFEFKTGHESEAAEFFRQGLHVVQDQPATTVWFAFRLGPTTYGAFAAFANEEDREALLAAGGPQMSATNAAFFETAPTFERVDVLASRQPGPA